MVWMDSPRTPDFRQIFTLLADQVESDEWWPGETRFEIVIGAVLVQNTNWANVEKAIVNLSEAGLLDPQPLIASEAETIGTLIRPAGYYNVKTRYIKAISQWFITHDHEATTLSDDELRNSLLAVRGIGAETADDIVLYVYHRPVFIYDSYARRLLEAAGFGSYPSYDKAKRALDPLLHAASFTTDELAAFHGLIVNAGKLSRRLGGWSTAYQLLAEHRFAEASNR